MDVHLAEMQTKGSFHTEAAETLLDAAIGIWTPLLEFHKPLLF